MRVCNTITSTYSIADSKQKENQAMLYVKHLELVDILCYIKENERRGCCYELYTVI